MDQYFCHDLVSPVEDEFYSLISDWDSSALDINFISMMPIEASLDQVQAGEISIQGFSDAVVSTVIPLQNQVIVQEAQDTPMDGQCDNLINMDIDSLLENHSKPSKKVQTARLPVYERSIYRDTGLLPRRGDSPILKCAGCDRKFSREGSVVRHIEGVKLQWDFLKEKVDRSISGLADTDLSSLYENESTCTNFWAREFYQMQRSFFSAVGDEVYKEQMKLEWESAKAIGMLDRDYVVRRLRNMETVLKTNTSRCDYENAICYIVNGQTYFERLTRSSVLEN
ncbi:hypothetical protein BGZ49_000074 [Haplosporangium sp. Z 27]|nr:hypothetical protein BGZ49_000074 [Haplosporangium sp. Z 27]